MSEIYGNVNNTAFQKHCLLKYSTAPFRQQTVYHRHQNMWQIPELARIISEFGYNVDVIDYDASCINLERKYSLLIDIQPNYSEVYEDALVPGCRKVLYATGAAPEWQTKHEQERLQEIAKRKRVKLPAKAYASSYADSISSFDAMLLIGNNQTLSTYQDVPIAKKLSLRNTATPCGYPPKYEKKSPRVFLYLATYPQALKGLDLLLEVFARNPDMVLIVCSQFKEEKDFCAIYEKELYQTANIIPVGIVDIAGDVFKKIAEIASYMVLPSCSEGMSGSVLTAMAAGLIPIVSRECGIDKEDAFFFPNCDVDSIEKTLRNFALKEKAWIKETSQKTVEIAEVKYHPKLYSQSVRSALRMILGQGIVLATTIAPKGDLTNQIAALNSWVEAGFSVISVNNSEEIAVLRPLFPAVEFYAAPTDGREKFDKPFMYFDHLLAALKASGSLFCGIVNSDIHLVRKDIREVIYNECQEAFLFGARLDVTSLDDLETGAWYRGFDYFFFHRDVLTLYPPEEFCLGLPWWDYWIVLIPLSAGVPVKKIVSPVVYHLIHSTRYGIGPWVYLGCVLGKYFKPSFPLTPEVMGLYNGMMFHLIDDNSAVETITLSTKTPPADT